MQALEKITLAYLALQERAEKLQSVINATQYDLAELQAKYKTTKEQKKFLQTERNKWYDAYNEKATVEQADEIRNLKQCIEELESQLVALTPKEQRVDEPTDGYEAAKRVCRADFKASETTEKADGATPASQVLIIKLGASNDYLQYIVDRQYRKSGDSTFDTISNPAYARRFLTYSDVVLFLGATFPMDLVEVFNFDIDTLELEPAARVTSRQVRNLRRQIGVDTENKPMSEGKPNAIHSEEKADEPIQPKHNPYRDLA